MADTLTLPEVRNLVNHFGGDGGAKTMPCWEVSHIPPSTTSPWMPMTARRATASLLLGSIVPKRPQNSFHFLCHHPFMNPLYPPYIPINPKSYNLNPRSALVPKEPKLSLSPRRSAEHGDGRGCHDAAGTYRGSIGMSLG